MRSNTQNRPSQRRNTPTPGGRLRDRRILVPTSRELDALAEVLAGEGAQVVRCPLVAASEAPDPEPSRTWVRVLATGRFRAVVFMTAEGVACLAETATRTGIKDAFLDGLRRARIVTRGPNPACALYELGVPVEARAVEPTCSSVLRILRRWNLAGQHVGAQLCGDGAEGEVIRHLHEAGAHPHSVEPHRHAPSAEDEQVQELIHRMDGGAVDAAVFTQPSQAERLLQIAQQRDLVTVLRTGLARLHVTAVGAAALDCLDRLAVRVDAAPAGTLVPGQLVELLVDRLGPAPS